MKLSEKIYNITVTMPAKIEKRQVHFFAPANIVNNFEHVLRKNGQKKTSIFVQFMQKVISEDLEQGKQKGMF